MTRDEVRRYDVFGDLYGETQWVRYKDYDKALAAVEAERDALARILAALREPSDAVVESAGDAFDVVPDFVQRIIQAAVAAAEQEKL